jgi:hypothetical protein
MSSQPILADVPSILLRTILRSIARLTLIIVWAALLVAVTTIMLSLFLGTFQSTRNDKRQNIANLIQAIVHTYKAFR